MMQWSFETVTSDGTRYIADFEYGRTAAIRHTIIYPDGRTESWGESKPNELHPYFPAELRQGGMI